MCFWKKLNNHMKNCNSVKIKRLNPMIFEIMSKKRDYRMKLLFRIFGLLTSSFLL